MPTLSTKLQYVYSSSIDSKLGYIAQIAVNTTINNKEPNKIGAY